MARARAILVPLVLTAFLPACATTSKVKGDRDPLEKMNRGFYVFNDKLDHYVMEPVTNCYNWMLPERARKCVDNFFHNLSEPDNAVNDLLQGKAKHSGSDVGRFATNTTIGVVGLFDPATKFGMPRHEEDLGQTFAVWGIGEGPYLVLPFFGPSTLRDGLGTLTTSITKSLVGIILPVFSIGAGTRTSMDALETVNKRAGASDDLRAVNKAAVDRYVFIREAYRQHRTFLIYDGDPPPPAMPDDDTDGNGVGPVKPASGN